MDILRVGEGGWDIGSRAEAISPMTTLENYCRVTRPMDETSDRVCLLFVVICRSLYQGISYQGLQEGTVFVNWLN